MKYRQLGQSDLQVSQICFGCWQLSPRFWGDVPLKPWKEALHAALDAGVNFIDTADAYGDGYAETSLGDWFQQEHKRDNFILATKFYWNFYEGERYPETTYDYILRACDQSLKRLKTDYIDLYQIHAYDPLTQPDVVAAALSRLKKEGKIRWVGVSNMNPEQMRMYQRFMTLTTLQPRYNLVSREVEQQELPFCQANGIGVIPYSSLHKGLLTGKYSAEHTFQDFRKADPLFNGPGRAAINNGLNQIRTIASDLGLSVIELVVRWVITHPAITSAIIGIKEPDHITGVVNAATEFLPIGLWHQIGSIMDKAKHEAMEAQHS